MKTKLFNTENTWSGLFVRLTIALVLFPHGAQKMLGIFGGYGFSGTMDFFTGVLHYPWFLGFSVICIEFFAPLFLLAGFGTRIWSALTGLLMLGIIFSSHVQHGFFMNWTNNQGGEGFEFHLLAIGLSLIGITEGGGKYALDRVLLQTSLKRSIPLRSGA